MALAAREFSIASSGDEARGSDDTVEEIQSSEGEDSGLAQEILEAEHQEVELRLRLLRARRDSARSSRASGGSRRSAPTAGPARRHPE
eukprot:13148831-Heterocapsa_arctica.AAC.1